MKEDTKAEYRALNKEEWELHSCLSRRVKYWIRYFTNPCLAGGRQTEGGKRESQIRETSVGNVDVIFIGRDEGWTQSGEKNVLREDDLASLQRRESIACSGWLSTKDGQRWVNGDYSCQSTHHPWFKL
jgi:hypothetical protein